MAFVTMTAPAVGDPTRQDWAQLVSDNLNFLYGTSGNAAGLAQLVNGSFEESTAANTAPTGWSLSIASGNSTAVTTATADVAHGRQGFKMTTPGSVTGGVVLTSEFMLCATGVPFVLGWLLKCSTATTKVSVKVKWYDEAESIVSTDTLYTASSGNPTSWTYMQGTCTPPASARLFKVVLTGVDNSTAASVYWDGVGIWQTKGLSSVLFTSDGTYTPSPGVTKIKARMWGSGGGGGGGNTGNGNEGADGADSWVGNSSNKARGGAGGKRSGAAGSNVSPAFTSGFYQFGSYAGGGGATDGTGGIGGAATGGIASVGGAGGAAGGANNGAAGAITTGGGGGACNAGGGMPGAGGGAAGEYAEVFLDVSAGVPVSVQVKVGGAGGAGGTFSGSGGQGGSGLVIIEEII